MSGVQIKVMRDALIEQIYQRMHDNDRIFFLSADFGSPVLDKLREDFKDRFINVGIAEQNLINVSTGLALEGFTVYAYAIAGFLTMRAYEQIRTNLALLSQQKAINVNLIGVGSGVSYDMSGPSHHCLEDISIMRTLPNIILCSPCDWVTAEKFVEFSIEVKKPKYIRLDSKPLPRIYEENMNFGWQEGFCELSKGKDACIVSTGYMTHIALKVAKQCHAGVIDVFTLKPIDKDALFYQLKKYDTVITIEEAFKNKGGLDGLILNVINENNANIKIKNIGFDDKYLFKSGGRKALYEAAGLSEKEILYAITGCKA